MCQLHLGATAPLVSLQGKEMTLENAQGQSKETNVHDRTQTQGPDRVRQEALGSEEVCTSFQWLTVTVPSLLGSDVFFIVGSRGIPRLCLLPQQGQSLAPWLLSSHSLLCTRELHSSSRHEVATSCYQGALGSPGSQAEQWLTSPHAWGGTCHQKMVQHWDRLQAQWLHWKQNHAKCCGLIIPAA